MTAQQTTVMWLGIALILTRLFTTAQWSHIWNTVNPAPASPSGTTKGGIGGCPKGHIMVNGKCLTMEA
jgi:hypothetical protein